MANSTVKLVQIVRDAQLHPDLAPVIQSSTGGSALEPALTIASNVMTELICEKFNFKFNRIPNLPFFYTNSYQQDYGLNVVNLGWLEYGVLLDINNTSTPQPIWLLETVKDLPQTSAQYGQPGQVSWMYNDQLTYATWGATNASNGSTTGTWPNPQALQTITSPIGVTAMPNNPLIQCVDASGLFWTVTTYGTTGSVNPFQIGLSNGYTLTPVYPTQTSPTTTATTVTDGTVVWTALNPKGQGIRCNPLPPQTGVVYQFRIVGQYRPFAFSNGPFTRLDQTIEPVPDDFAKWFRDGFIALGYAYSPDTKVRGKWQDLYNIWMAGLLKSKIQGDREQNNQGFFPSSPLLQGGSNAWLGPAYPFPYGW